MRYSLENLVDGLAEALGSWVAIDDRSFRLQAYSGQEDRLHVDRARMSSILHRAPPPDIKEWIASLGISEAGGPLQTLANPDLGIARRTCIPIRHADRLMGYLWLTGDVGFSDDDLRRAADAATLAGDIMYREQLVDDLGRGRERELLQDLLGGEADVRMRAGQTLIHEELFIGNHRARVMVLQLGRTTETELLPTQREVFEQVIERLRRSVSPHSGLGLARFDHAVLLVSSTARADVMQLANELRSLSTEQFSDGSYTVIGLSAPLSTLADAPSAYEQARLAARVSARIPRFEGVAAWDELGVYRLLSVFPAEELRRQLIGGHLQRLIEADRAGTLVTTLETYLDLGGNIQATASTLVLHRASLYHRLDRIQEILEISLRDGEARLELHLSLKLARIAGLETARPSSRPPRPQARSASAGHD